MKKIIYMMMAAVFGAVITSCSSNDEELNNEEPMSFIEELASQHSDTINDSLLYGAWTEIGYVAIDEKYECYEEGQNEEYARQRFSISNDTTLTRYIYFGTHIKVVRKYDYNPDTRQFYIINDPDERGVIYQIENLSEDYMTLAHYNPCGVIYKRILQRVDEEVAAEWEDSYKLEVRGSISDYGVCYKNNEWYLMDGFEPFGASRFQEIIVGHPLKCLELHKILDDGSISEFPRSGEYEYLFGETALKEIVFSMASVSQNIGPWIENDFPYTYDEANNKVCGSQQLIILSYDEEKDQVLMILRPHNLFAIYQRMPMEWWMELEAQSCKGN